MTSVDTSTPEGGAPRVEAEAEAEAAIKAAGEPLGTAEADGAVQPPIAEGPKRDPDDAAPDAGDEMTGWAFRITRAWRDTLGAYATDEGETRTLLRRLVDFGALSKEEAGRTLAQVRTRIDENRQELDRRVEETLSQTLGMLPFPTPAELTRLRERVRELEERVAQLEQN